MCKVIISIIILIVTLIILVKSSDLLVESAARLASLLGVSGYFIGLTIVAIGTSVPELAAGIAATFKQNTSFVVGEIIGSNVANIGLVLGVAATLAVLNIRKKIYTKDVLFLLIASILFYLLALDGSISMIEGIAFLFLFVLYIIYKFNTPEHIPEKKYATFSFNFMHRKKTASIKEYKQALEEHMSKAAYQKLLKGGIDVKKAYKQALVSNIWKNAFIIAICCAAIIFAAHYLVDAAIDIATIMGISTEFIGLSVVAFGTSLPELSVTLSAVKKKLPNILIGNLLGSGITNILLVLGVTSIIHPLSISTFDIVFGIPYVILMALLCLKFIKVNWISQVLSGITLFFFYAVFIFGSFLLTWL